jgi:alginate O-acetyltransferase complex protein AlgI
MIFSTHWFLVFLAVAAPAYWFARAAGVRLFVLATAGLVFHVHFAGPAGVGPILLLGGMTYLAGLGGRPWLLVAGIVTNVLALVFYKYTHFLAANLALELLPAALREGVDRASAVVPEVPPLGVSFFVFEFVHYLIEVRRGQAPLVSPGRFWLFAFFFPSLVAGPVKRVGDFLPALDQGLRICSLADLQAGILRIVLGYAKKFVVADPLTGAIRHWEAGYADLPLGGRWLFLAALGVRILADFSAYSDLAIGTARLFGVRLPENFNWPYRAVNLREFWQRWHISLSTWIRDYVYIPLGGSRHGPGRRLLAVTVAFAICGLWHGPAWNFVLWGLWHGAGLSACSLLSGPGSTGSDRGSAAGRVLAWGLTMLHVHLGWLLFFYPAPRCFELARLLFVP